MIRTNIHLSEKQLDGLRRLAEKTGLSVAELVRRAIDALLEREARKDRPRKDH